MQYAPDHYNVLDKGFVRVVDRMGDDSSIVQAARVSYGAGTKTLREDEKLIEYLMRNEHMSPFEMCEIKLHIKAPIFVARQWVRHRTASWNEVSGRYSEMEPEFYIPASTNVTGQSKTNRQGGGEELPASTRVVTPQWIRSASEGAYQIYRAMLCSGVSRELARIVLPLNLYTEWYWKIDLRNYLHFLHLRNDPHAQFEMRQYAAACDTIAADWVPVTHKAWRATCLASATNAND